MSLVNPSNIENYLISLPPVDIDFNQNVIETLSQKQIGEFDRLWDTKMAISCIDLTSLESTDNDDKIYQMYLKARKPIESDPNSPSVAALCIYPQFIANLKMKQDVNSPIKIATIAGGFPFGNIDSGRKIAEVKSALTLGADEVDFVLNRELFLAGNFADVFSEIETAKKLTHDFGAKLKVIIETGDLGSDDNIKNAATLVLHAGADFVKSSTGKSQVSATFNSSLLLMQSVFEYYNETGIKKGLKPSGGFRSTDQALFTISLLKHTLGNDWLNPNLFRFGASGLLNELVKSALNDTSSQSNYFTNNSNY